MKTRVLTEAAGQWLIRFRHARLSKALQILRSLLEEPGPA